MLVKELIEKLEKCDPDATVKIAIGEATKSGRQYWVDPFGDYLNQYVAGRVGINCNLPDGVHSVNRKKLF